MKKNFIIKLGRSLKKLLPSPSEFVSSKLLLAVSGGADSTALLIAMVELQKVLNFSISVLTVNHNLREKKESAEDAEFVLGLCKSLGVECKKHELLGEKIREFATAKKCGIEAAARHFRYKALYDRAEEIGADFILTAHNLNDYYETVLMRIFQGGNPENLQGLKAKRGILIRPMLNISRAEIIGYLKAENQNYREDSTNKSLDFLRNRIRLKLVPTLDECFPNWQKSLDKTLAKISWDCETLNPEYFLYNFIKYNLSKLKNIFISVNKNEVVIDTEIFELLPPAVKRRVLMKAFGKLKIKRLSFNFIKKCMFLRRGQKCEIGRCGVHFGKNLTVYKKCKTISGFSVWVDNFGEFSFPQGSFFVSATNNANKNKSEVELKFKDKKGSYKKFGPFELPFYLRSVQLGDKIRIGKNAYKSVKKILSENGVPERKTHFVPIVEKQGEVQGIWGELVQSKNRKRY
ncbi:MAG: tRNA lysidine(34) synthetase TilS [Treponemataceae bacterium]